MNPYRGLPDHQFWSKGVTWTRPGGLDPIVSAPTITASEKIVTMGSCFAQHLARNLTPLGLNYYVAEPAPVGLSAYEAERRGFGIFSCRFGNIYTTRQAVQLFDRAFGRFVPEDDVWQLEGGFVDAFRPRIEPTPHIHRSGVKNAAADHLACVRQMFLGADWLIFTLGLTEGWRSNLDGAMYPLAPGVSAGEFNSDKYEFVNFSASEVSRDLAELIERLSEVNPRCRVLLTVSPVALIATFEKRHVLVSTAASKAALRVAADEAERAHSNVTYFPSYEIITSPSSEGRYFADDYRNVTDLGVAHVMRIFKKHFIDRAPALQPSGSSKDGLLTAAGVVCDEEEIQRSVRQSLS